MYWIRLENSKKTLEEVMVCTIGKTPSEWMERTTRKPRNLTWTEPTYEEEDQPNCDSSHR